MSDDALSYLGTFPEVPEDERPRELFVDYFVPAELRESLLSRGWEVKDIRLLSKQDSIEGLLEGMRVGSIAGRDISTLKVVLDLETRIEGMLNAKERAQSDKDRKKAKTVFDLLESMGSDNGTRKDEFKPRRKPGRRGKTAKEIEKKLLNG